MIANLASSLGVWTWWILGVVLLALEIFAPGNVLVWFGIAAIVTGILAFFVELPWQTEALIFVALAVVMALVGRRYFARESKHSEQPLLNERAARLVGQSFVLSEPIVDGQGRLRIDDTNWRVTGPDLPSGTRVRVTGKDGAVLSVGAVLATTPTGASLGRICRQARACASPARTAPSCRSAPRRGRARSARTRK
jgi:membrane protein implicated in regulation of membrane protease activity